MPPPKTITSGSNMFTSAAKLRAEPMLVGSERSNRVRLAGLLCGRNLFRRKLFLGERKILSRQACSRKVGFYTTLSFPQ